MDYLNKTIQKVFIIDTFNPTERAENRITARLEAELTKLNVENEAFNVDSAEQVLNALANISRQNLGNGAIIHIVGHGARNNEGVYTGFGGSQFTMRWEAIRALLVQINTRCNDGLIINTSIMCHGEGIYQIINGVGRPFNTAVTSLVDMSQKGLDHNVVVYKRCERRDLAEFTWNSVNSGLEEMHPRQIFFQIRRVEL